MCDPTFCRFIRTPTCDRHGQTQTDRQTDTGPWLVAALAQRRAGKIDRAEKSMGERGARSTARWFAPEPPVARLIDRPPQMESPGSAAVGDGTGPATGGTLYTMHFYRATLARYLLWRWPWK